VAEDDGVYPANVFCLRVVAWNHHFLVDDELRTDGGGLDELRGLQRLRAGHGRDRDRGRLRCGDSLGRDVVDTESAPGVAAAAPVLRLLHLVAWASGGWRRTWSAGRMDMMLREEPPAEPPESWRAWSAGRKDARGREDPPEEPPSEPPSEPPDTCEGCKSA
jgi:hypothetical protein